MNPPTCSSICHHFYLVDPLSIVPTPLSFVVVHLWRPSNLEYAEQSNLKQYILSPGLSTLISFPFKPSGIDFKLTFPAISKFQASMRESLYCDQDPIDHLRSSRLTFPKTRFISKIFQSTFRLPLFKTLDLRLTFLPVPFPIIITL